MIGKKYLLEKKESPALSTKVKSRELAEKRNEFPAENFENQIVSASLLAESRGEKNGKNASPRASSLCTMTERAWWYV